MTDDELAQAILASCDAFDALMKSQADSLSQLARDAWAKTEAGNAEVKKALASPPAQG